MFWSPILRFLFHKSPCFVVHLALLCNFSLTHHCTINRGLIFFNCCKYFFLCVRASFFSAPHAFILLLSSLPYHSNFDEQHTLFNGRVNVSDESSKREWSSKIVNGEPLTMNKVRLWDADWVGLKGGGEGKRSA